MLLFLYKRRVRAIFDNTGWMEESGRQEAWWTPDENGRRGCINALTKYQPSILMDKI